MGVVYACLYYHMESADIMSIVRGGSSCPTCGRATPSLPKPVRFQTTAWHRLSL